MTVNKICRHYLIAAVVLLMSHNLMAEDYLAMNLEDLLNVSVTGSTLREESLQTVPSAVTVFTHQEIKTLGLDYLYELLGHVPGFQVSRNGDSPSGYTVSARGRRNSAEAREILLIVDGQVLADPRTGSADGSLPHFPLVNVERVEVIRGPGSAIYGSGAFTGVVNVITRKDASYVTAGSGSFNRRKLNLGFNQPIGSWIATLAAGLDSDDGDKYRQFFGTQIESTTDPRSIYFVNANFFSDQTRLTASIYRTQSKNFLIGEQLNNELNDYIQDFRQLGLEQSFQPVDSWKIKLSAGYTWIEQNLTAQLSPENYFTNISQPSSSEALKAYGVFKGESLRLMFANDHNLDENNNIQWGLSFQTREETNAVAHSNFNLEQLASGQFPIEYYVDFSHSFPIGLHASQDATGAYGQWIHSLSKDLRMTLGGRYDNYQYFDSRFSPRVGLVNDFSTNTQLKLLYGEAFRAPSLSETGLLNNPVLIGNPELESELVKTWEIILQQNWESTLVNLTGFHNLYEQPISTGFRNGVRSYVNGSDQTAQGFSSEFMHSLADGLVLKMNLTHYVDLPDPAFRESKNLANLMLMWNYQNWNLGMSYQYQGARQTLVTTNESVTLPSSQIVNFQMSYQLQKNLNLELKCKNLLNETRVSPTQGAGFTSGVPLRGEDWTLAVTWDW